MPEDLEPASDGGVELNAWERRLVDAVARGVPCDFRAEAKAAADGDAAVVAAPVVSAALVQALLLGAPTPDGAQPPRVRTGLRLYGATLDGELNLSDALTIDGGPIPALIFKKCRFSKLDARFARIRRLSLKNCAFDEIDISSAVVEGYAEFSGSGPRAEDGECRILGYGVEIRGGLAVARSRLVVDARSDLAPDVKRRIALDFSDAKISGDVTLRPDFVAEGGVGFGDARIGGGLWADGAEISKGETESAVWAQSARIEGPLVLRLRDDGDGPVPFRAKGQIWLYDARISGGLDMSGAQLDNGDEIALVADNADINGLCNLNVRFDGEGVAHPLIAKGALSLLRARIRGTLTLSGAEISAPDTAVVATGVSVEGGVQLNAVRSKTGELVSFKATGSVDFSNAEVAEDFDAYGAKIIAKNGFAFRGGGATFQGAVRLAVSYYDEEGEQPEFSAFEAHGGVTFFDAEIGTLMMYGAQLSVPEDGDSQIALYLVGAEIKGGCYLRTFDLARGAARFEAVGQIIMSSAKIGGLLDMSGARIRCSDYGALIGSGLSVEGTADFTAVSDRVGGLHRFETEGGVELSQARFGRSLNFGGAKLISGGAIALSLQSVTVGGGVYLGGHAVGEIGARFETKGGVSFHGASVGENVDIGEVRIVGAENTTHSLIMDNSTIGRSITVNGSFDRALHFDGMTVAGSFFLGANAYVGGETQLKLSPPADDHVFFTSFLGQFDTGLVALRAMKIQGRLAVSDWVIERTEGATKPFVVDLRDLYAGSLDDKRGAGWPDGVLMKLDGMKYDHISGEETGAGAASRLRWLSLQYPDQRPTMAEFRPQPYEQVSRVLRAHGSLAAARQVLSAKLRVEQVLMPRLLRPLYWLYGLFFGYGLSVPRALGTFILWFALGWFAIDAANSDGMMVREQWLAAGARSIPQAAPAPPEACGDEITPWVYALDLTLPILDLHEEMRCKIRPTAPEDPVLVQAGPLGSFAEADIWRSGHAFYSLVGWVITSLTLLTVTGVFRRIAER